MKTELEPSEVFGRYRNGSSSELSSAPEHCVLCSRGGVEFSQRTDACLGLA